MKVRGSRAAGAGAPPTLPPTLLPTMPLLLLASKIGAAAAQVSKNSLKNMVDIQATADTCLDLIRLRNYLHVVFKILFLDTLAGFPPDRIQHGERLAFFFQTQVKQAANEAAKLLVDTAYSLATQDLDAIKKSYAEAVDFDIVDLVS